MRSLVDCDITLDRQTGFRVRKADLALPILVLMSLSAPPSFAITLPKYVNESTSSRMPPSNTVPSSIVLFISMTLVSDQILYINFLENFVLFLPYSCIPTVWIVSSLYVFWPILLFMITCFMEWYNSCSCCHYMKKMRQCSAWILLNKLTEH